MSDCITPDYRHITGFRLNVPPLPVHQRDAIWPAAQVLGTGNPAAAGKEPDSVLDGLQVSNSEESATAPW
jgi:hypothetical protein